MRSKLLFVLGMSVIAITTTTATAHAGKSGNHHAVVELFEDEGVAPACAWPSVVWLDGDCTGVLVHPQIVLYPSACGDVHGSVWFGEVALQGNGRVIATASCQRATMLDGREWAYCRLAEEVTDVPIVPIAMGCEHEDVSSEKQLVAVGFTSEPQGLIDKRHRIARFGADVGGDGELPSICERSEARPVFMRLDPSDGGDGSWRLLGVTSGAESCGPQGYEAFAAQAVPWIEETTGLDVSPCHFPNGQWGPSSACRGFPLDPGSPSSTDRWLDGCTNAFTSDWGASCGSPFDDRPDGAPPRVHISEPQDNAWIPFDDGHEWATVDVHAWTSDDHSGVVRVHLLVNDIPVDGAHWPSSQDADGLTWTWPPLLLSAGSHKLAASAEDHAGNYVLGPSIVINIGVEPTPGTSDTGGGNDSSGTDDGTGGETGGATFVGSSAGPEESSEGAAPIDVRIEHGGCGCRTRPARARGLMLLVCGLALRRRRWQRGPS